MAYIALAISAFADKGAFDNQSMQYAMFGAGTFLVLNSVFFSWGVLDENTKILILAIAISGLLVWTYTLKRSKVSQKSPKTKKGKKRYHGKTLARPSNLGYEYTRRHHKYSNLKNMNNFQ